MLREERARRLGLIVAAVASWQRDHDRIPDTLEGRVQLETIARATRVDIMRAGVLPDDTPELEINWRRDSLGCSVPCFRFPVGDGPAVANRSKYRRPRCRCTVDKVFVNDAWVCPKGCPDKQPKNIVRR